MIAAPVWSRQFVGRAEELAALHALRRAAGQRQGAAALIGGPAGIGKSRLVAEFLRRLGGGRAPLVVRTECLEVSRSTAGPLREIVEQLGAGLDALAGEAGNQDAFFRALERVLRDACEARSIVLCIDDLHWADPATLDFLAYIVPRIGSERILLIGTYRDDEVDSDPQLLAAFARLWRARNVHRMLLQPLGAAEIDALVASALDDRRAPPEAVVRAVAVRAAGNPFYAEEFLKAALEGGDQKKIPDSIRGTILERFHDLEAQHQRVILHAAILGYRFEAESLAALLEVGVDELLPSLARARANNLIAENGERFRFRHALTQEAIAAEMLELEARPLHARVAHLLERRADSSARVDEIAFHWWRAREPEKGLASNEAAAGRALAVFAYADAQRHYERALEFASSREDRVRLLVASGAAAVSRDDFEGSIRAFDAMIRLHLDAGDRGAALMPLISSVNVLSYVGRYAEGRERVRRFLASHGPHLSDEDRLMLSVIPLLSDSGLDVRAARRAIAANPARGRLTGDRVRLVRSAELVAAAIAGDVEEFRSAAEDLRKTAAVSGPFHRSSTLQAIAFSATMLATDRALAGDALLEAKEATDELRLQQVGYLAGIEAYHLFLHGELEAARERAYLARAHAESLHERWAAAIGGVHIGLACDDDALRAAAHDDYLREQVDDPEGVHLHALLAAGIAADALARGDLPSAQSILAKAIGKLQSPLGAQLLLPLAARHLPLEDLDLVRRPFAEMYATDRAGHATRAMVEAIVAGRAGQADALALARKAAALYREQGWPLLEASALELSGDVAGALALYERHGARPDIRRLRAPEPAGELFSPREAEIAALVAEGCSNLEIADRVGLSVKTVEKHLSAMYLKLGIKSRTQLASQVAARGG